MLGGYRDEEPDGRFTPRAEGLVDALAKQAEFGALDGLFLGTAVIKTVAHQLNVVVFGPEDTADLEQEGGGAGPCSRSSSPTSGNTLSSARAPARRPASAGLTG